MFQLTPLNWVLATCVLVDEPQFLVNMMVHFVESPRKNFVSSSFFGVLAFCTQTRQCFAKSEQFFARGDPQKKRMDLMTSLFTKPANIFQ